MHGLVVLGRARAVGPTDDPDQAGRGLDQLGARGHAAAPARPGDEVGLRPGPRCALARHGEDVRPSAQHRHQVVAPLLVRDGEDVRLATDVHEGAGIERVGIRCGDGSELRVRVLPEIGELAHRRVLALGCGHVGQDAPGHLHGHERVAVDVGVDGQVQGIGHRMIADDRRVPRHALSPGGGPARADERDRARACGEEPSGDIHDRLPAMARSSRRLQNGLIPLRTARIGRPLLKRRC